MRTYHRWTILACSLFFLVLAVSCSDQTDSSQEEADPRAETGEASEGSIEDEGEGTDELEGALDAPEIPGTIEELITYPIGPLAGLSYEESSGEIEEALATLPKLDGDANEGTDEDTARAYYAKLYSLFAEDFRDPADLIDEWKMNDFGNPELDDPRLEFKENYNVEIILDASGSMAAVIDGQTMMELAKEAIRDFAESLPEEANVALRVYGHKGSNDNADKQVSCESSELVYDLQPYDANKLNDALNQFEPTGWTPIARSLEGAKEDLADYDGENNTNIIYLVSDGVETCDGDPVKVANELSDSNIMPLLNVIGFNVNSEGQKQLREVAEAADGYYTTVRNQEQLQAELDRSQEMATRWLEWRLDADTENINTVLDRESSIFDFKFDWGDKKNREYQNLDRAIRFLFENDYIPTDVRDTMRELRQEHYNLVNKSEQTTYNDLMSLAKQSYREMQEEISKKYRDRNE